MIEFARVVAIHPGAHAVDAIIQRTGQRVVGAPVLSSVASTLAGRSDLPPVSAPEGDARWNIPARGENDIIIALAPTAGGNWIGVGCKFPEINAVLHGQPGLSVYRHSSGAWHMIAPDGTVTIGHPSGAVAVMGPNTTPVDPVGGDVHGQWRNSGPNASAQVGLTLNLPSGASIAIATDGKATFTFPAEVQFNVPLAKFSGDVQVEGDVTAGPVSLRNHHHSGVTPGGGESGPPVA